MNATNKLIRPLVHNLHAYVPGEQPKIQGLIKLNTNENPYPPSPGVLAAVRAAVDGRLRLYPNPTAQVLREKLARLHGCRAENIIVGNGSDELLAMAMRCFVEPKPSTPMAKISKQVASTVQYFTPSYSLYPVLADIHGAKKNVTALNPDFSMPRVRELKRGRQWNFNAALTFVTTPNAPSGRGYKTVELEKFCTAQKGVVILDEAYVDFAEENALKLALKFPHVLVARTFSKAYSLCFQRVGYFVGHAELIAALTFVTTPNAPSGRGYKTSELEKFCAAQKGVVILDEAYVDFAEENALKLALKFPHVLVARTFSKAYSLCFQRVGYFVGHAELIAALDKIRDSYNVNGLGQIAAAATLDEIDYYRANIQKIIATREWSDSELTKLGFRVFPSQTNFILVRPPKFPANDWLQKLREQKILVRWFNAPEVQDYLRITIGTQAEAEALVQVARKIISK